jgi:glutathione S-transferase
MKLYYHKGSCSLAVRIAINELQLDCKYEAVDFETNLTEGGIDYSTINPKGSIPLFRIPEGELLSEVAIILQYLADNNPEGETFIPKEMSLSRYRVLEIMNYIASDIHQTVSLFSVPDIPKAIKNSVLRVRLDKKLSYIEKLLWHSTYITGNNYSFADSYLYVILSRFEHLGIAQSAWPHVQSYYENLKKRPAIIKSLEEEEDPIERKMIL